MNTVGHILNSERASRHTRQRGIARMAKAVSENVGWLEVIRFLLRDCPIIGLLVLLIVNLPDITERIESGYKNNATQLQNIANTNLDTAKTYQQNSERRDKELREMNERLITEIKTYHDSMVRFLLENRLKIQSLEDATLTPPRVYVPTPAPWEEQSGPGTSQP